MTIANMARQIRLKRKLDRGDWSRKRLCVTLMSPKGMYPEGTFSTDGALFHADGEVVFVATYGARWSGTNTELPYSEVDWLEPEVVRLLGALMMTERFPDGLRSRFYPVPHSNFIINEASLDFTDHRTTRQIKSALFATIENRLWPHVQGVWAQYLGQKLCLFDSGELSMDSLPKYWERISVNNLVLLRGVQALIKSDMLAAHPEFLEEAAIATFIALDASHEMVLRHLRDTGVANPSSADAGAWLLRTFDEPLGVYGAERRKYFEDLYVQRVQTVHPASRFGDVPFAPVMADDAIHLRQALPGVFGYLVLGEHNPLFWEEVAMRSAGRVNPDTQPFEGKRLVKE